MTTSESTNCAVVIGSPPSRWRASVPPKMFALSMAYSRGLLGLVAWSPLAAASYWFALLGSEAIIIICESELFLLPEPFKVLPAYDWVF